MTMDDSTIPLALQPVIDRLHQIIRTTHGTAAPCPVA